MKASCRDYPYMENSTNAFDAGKSQEQDVSALQCESAHFQAQVPTRVHLLQNQIKHQEVSTIEGLCIIVLCVHDLMHALQHRYEEYLALIRSCTGHSKVWTHPELMNLLLQNDGHISWQITRSSVVDTLAEVGKQKTGVQDGNAQSSLGLCTK